MAQVLAAVPTVKEAVLVAVELSSSRARLSADIVLNVLARLNASAARDGKTTPNSSMRRWPTSPPDSLRSSTRRQAARRRSTACVTSPLSSKSLHGMPAPGRT
jgi:hypothetical protein